MTPRTEKNTADQIQDSVRQLFSWLESHNFEAWDPFDGLNSRLLRPFTFERPWLRTILQQSIRRFPINLRPLLGMRPSRSTKGMGFIARACIRLHQATGEPIWAMRAREALQWLAEKQSTGYSGACWGNHFDYQSRVFYLPAGVPTIVWTALIGHAFLDAYDHFGDAEYLATAESACEHILNDLDIIPQGEGACISYIPHERRLVHNANVLGASLLARTYHYCRNDEYLGLARRAILYTASHQRPDGSWYYGESPNLHWIDNFHTAYVLDCLKHYEISTADTSFSTVLAAGYSYLKRSFFLEDGTPKYYATEIWPIDIQCSSQAIDTLVFFADQDSEALSLAMKVGCWTIANMQDRSGYFYYRRYGRLLINKTPTLHWGQATMLCALANLCQQLQKVDHEKQSSHHCGEPSSSLRHAGVERSAVTR